MMRLFIFFISCTLLNTYRVYGAIEDNRFNKKKKITYKTSFASCPSRSVGKLTLKLIKVFEENESLKDVKKSIVEEHLDEKHFISDYKVSYDPLLKKLSFKYKCPEPLMKVQIYKNNGIDSYEAILVDNGKLFDPTYEILLQSEKKLNYHLPYLALPIGDMQESIQLEITKIIKDLPIKFRKKISEVILNEKGELTIIMSLKGNPSSIFLGRLDWSEKVHKLQKIVHFMEGRKKIPAIINLTNAKKVVVKFNNKF